MLEACLNSPQRDPINSGRAQLIGTLTKGSAVKESLSNVLPSPSTSSGATETVTCPICARENISTKEINAHLDHCLTQAQEKESASAESTSKRARKTGSPNVLLETPSRRDESERFPTTVHTIDGGLVAQLRALLPQETSVSHLRAGRAPVILFVSWLEVRFRALTHILVIEPTQETRLISMLKDAHGDLALAAQRYFDGQETKNALLAKTSPSKQAKISAFFGGKRDVEAPLKHSQAHDRKTSSRALGLVEGLPPAVAEPVPKVKSVPVSTRATSEIPCAAHMYAHMAGTFEKVTSVA